MKRSLSVVAAIALTALAGCSSSGSQTRSPFDGPATGSGTGDRIRVEIQNLSFNDITVWAVRPGGQRIRVARVTGKTDQNATIDWNVAQPISFFVEQVSGRSCRTGQIGVEPGARVWLNVPNSVGAQPCRAGRR
jgi:hypothetical protein